MIGLYKRGDTLIEVILAFSVFSMVMIAGLALMNLGVSRTQASLQITMVRNSMNNQAEFLRYINETYLVDRSSAEATVWRDQIRNKAISGTPDALSNGTRSCPTSAALDGNRFAIREDNMGIISSGQIGAATNFATINSGTSEGLWIQAISPQGTGNRGYLDFYIHACWFAPGSEMPTTLGTIVRLYDPELL